MKLKIIVLDLEISSRFKHRILRTSLATLVLGMSVVADAAIHPFVRGDVLTASDLNGNFSDLDGRVVALESASPGSATASLAARVAQLESRVTELQSGALSSLTVAGDASIGGKLSIGVHIVTACTQNATAFHYDCACPTGEIAISGGAFSGGTNGTALNESRSGATLTGGTLSTWRLSCLGTDGNRSSCTTPFAICARLAP
jgi:hypothetical protein